MFTKKQRKKQRVDAGNKQTAQLLLYLNFRFPSWKLIDFCGSKSDKDDGKDFGSKTKSYQSKYREAGKDVIYESDQFLLLGGGKFRHRPGRDARCKADYYIVKPKGEQKLVFAEPEYIKSKRLEVIQEWGMKTRKATAYNGVECDLVDVTPETMLEWYKIARDREGKCFCLFESSTGVQVWYGIDEGEDDERYGKLLFYFPSDSIQGKELTMKPGEDINDPSTWKR